MSSYVLDVTNPRIKKCMLSLGIDAEELIKKTSEDFNARDVSEEIKCLRYNFFIRKQQELVRQIKALVKEEILRGLERVEQEKKPKVPSQDLMMTSVSFNTYDELEKTKLKHKEIVDKTFDEVKEAFNESKAIENKLKKGEIKREQAKSAMSRKREKLMELKEKQKENFQKIKVLEERNIHKFYRKYASTQRKEASRIKLAGSLLEKSRNNSLIFEFDITDRIQQYESKMNKSKELYDLSIKNKKQAASKLLERSARYTKLAQTNNDSQIIEKISKLVTKTKTAENRRYLFLKQQAEDREKSKEKQDERRTNAQKKFREKEIFSIKRAQAIEKKMKVSNNLLEQKHSN